MITLSSFHCANEKFVGTMLFGQNIKGVHYFGFLTFLLTSFLKIRLGCYAIRPPCLFYLYFTIILDTSVVPHCPHQLCHTFFLLSLAGLKPLDCVDKVLGGATTVKLDLLKGRFEETIGHFVPASKNTQYSMILLKTFFLGNWQFDICSDFKNVDHFDIWLRCAPASTLLPKK